MVHKNKSNIVERVGESESYYNLASNKTNAIKILNDRRIYFY